MTLHALLSIKKFLYVFASDLLHFLMEIPFCPNPRLQIRIWWVLSQVPLAAATVAAASARP